MNKFTPRIPKSFTDTTRQLNSAIVNIPDTTIYKFDDNAPAWTRDLYDKVMNGNRAMVNLKLFKRVAFCFSTSKPSNAIDNLDYVEFDHDMSTLKGWLAANTDCIGDVIEMAGEGFSEYWHCLALSQQNHIRAIGESLFAEVSAQVSQRRYDPFNDPDFDPDVDVWTAKQLRAVTPAYLVDRLDQADNDYWWWLE